MKISLLPSGYKTTSRFTRPAHIKNDTHYLYTSEKYVAEIVYHSSMFYAPEFYKVSVCNKTGEQIWSGGDTMFLDSLFRSDFLSDAHDRMILTRVNSTESSNHMQIVMVDLKTGAEEVLTEEGFYHGAGHFISFDCVYYASKGVCCIDYANNKKFLLQDILKEHFTNIQTWGACAVKDCILVITAEEENNIYLFNLIKQQIKDRATLRRGTADSINVSVGHVMPSSNSIISVSYSDRQVSGALKYRSTQYFNLEF